MAVAVVLTAGADEEAWFPVDKGEKAKPAAPISSPCFAFLLVCLWVTPSCVQDCASVWVPVWASPCKGSAAALWTMALAHVANSSDAVTGLQHS